MRLGDEVSADRPFDLIARAAFLMFLRSDEGSLVGVSALKHPRPAYRDSVFRRANSDLDPRLFGIELGLDFCG